MYLDNYFSMQFIDQLDNYIKTHLIKLLKACTSDVNFCSDEKVKMYILPGEETHWRDSLMFAKINGGLLHGVLKIMKRSFLKPIGLRIKIKVLAFSSLQ